MIVRARRQSWKADLALVGITAIWGTTFLVVKDALAGISPLLFLALRFAVAALALGIIFRPLPSKFGAGRRLLKPSLGASVLLFAGFVFQTIGLKYTSASKAAFITGLSIVLVPLLSAVIERKPPRPSEWLGACAATLGLALLTLPGEALRISHGDLLVLMCAFAFAGHIVMMGHYAPRLGFQAFTFTQVAITAALAFASIGIAERPAMHSSPAVWGAIAITGVLATAVAFSVQAWAQQYTTATRTALIFALEPVFAMATAYVFAGEVLTPRGAAGAALILGGILLVELKPL